MISPVMTNDDQSITSVSTSRCFHQPGCVMALPEVAVVIPTARCKDAMGTKNEGGRKREGGGGGGGFVYSI